MNKQNLIDAMFHHISDTHDLDDRLLLLKEVCLFLASVGEEDTFKHGFRLFRECIGEVENTNGAQDLVCFVSSKFYSIAELVPVLLEMKMTEEAEDLICISKVEIDSFGDVYLKFEALCHVLPALFHIGDMDSVRAFLPFILKSIESELSDSFVRAEFLEVLKDFVENDLLDDVADILVTTKSSPGKGVFLCRLANVFSERGESAKASKFLSEAVGVASESEYSDLSDYMFKELAVSMAISGDFEKAYHYISLIKDPLDRTEACVETATFCHKAGDVSKVVQSLSRAMEYIGENSERKSDNEDYLRSIPILKSLYLIRIARLYREIDEAEEFECSLDMILVPGYFASHLR
jgi:uncharacterized protein YbaR (Trm112 family)